MSYVILKLDVIFDRENSHYILNADKYNLVSHLWITS